MFEKRINYYFAKKLGLEITRILTAKHPSFDFTYKISHKYLKIYVSSDFGIRFMLLDEIPICECLRELINPSAQIRYMEIHLNCVFNKLKL